MPPESTAADMEKKFTSHSLEYQLSTLNRARHFARYLDAIRCFYTDKPVDYDMVGAFTPAHAAVFAPMEHERWVREHIAMGWRRGDEYEALTKDLPEAERKAARAALREQLRRHKLTMDGDPTEAEVADHYRGLDEVDQDKDWKPFNRMLQLLRKYDGTRIYSLESMEK